MGWGGVGCGGANNFPWHLHTNMMLRWRWGGAGLITRVKFNNRFVVAGTQQVDSTWKVLKKMEADRFFAQKDKSHGGTNENRWKWARSFQWRHNASITSSILEELPACLWQS